MTDNKHLYTNDPTNFPTVSPTNYPTYYPTVPTQIPTVSNNNEIGYHSNWHDWADDNVLDDSDKLSIFVPNGNDEVWFVIYDQSVALNQWLIGYETRFEFDDQYDVEWCNVKYVACLLVVFHVSFCCFFGCLRIFHFCFFFHFFIICDDFNESTTDIALILAHNNDYTGAYLVQDTVYFTGEPNLDLFNTIRNGTLDDYIPAADIEWYPVGHYCDSDLLTFVSNNNDGDDDDDDDDNTVVLEYYFKPTNGQQ